MTTIIIISCLLLMQAKAQTWDEWWHQKKTRLKYLHKQVAALILLEKTVADGYSIAKNGILAIKQGKEAELALHQAFYKSLDSISPFLLPKKPNP